MRHQQPVACISVIISDIIDYYFSHLNTERVSKTDEVIGRLIERHRRDCAGAFAPF